MIFPIYYVSKIFFVLLLGITFDNQFPFKSTVNAAGLSWTLWDDTQACYAYNWQWVSFVRLRHLQSSRDCSIQITVPENAQLLIYALNVSMLNVGYVPTFEEVDACPDRYAVIQKSHQETICSQYALVVNSKHVMIELDRDVGGLMFHGRYVSYGSNNGSYFFNKCPETNISMDKTSACYTVNVYDVVTSPTCWYDCYLAFPLSCNSVLSKRKFLSFCNNDLTPNKVVGIMYHSINILRKFSVYNSSLTAIESNVFHGMSNLLELSFFENKLKVLPS